MEIVNSKIEEYLQRVYGTNDDVLIENIPGEFDIIFIDVENEKLTVLTNIICGE